MIETTGEGKSAVATPDGKKPKEEGLSLAKPGNSASIYIFKKINMRATTFYRADTFYRQITSKGKWFRTPEELRLREDQTASSIMFTENVSRK